MKREFEITRDIAASILLGVAGSSAMLAIALLIADIIS